MSDLNVHFVPAFPGPAFKVNSILSDNKLADSYVASSSFAARVLVWLAGG